MKIRKTEKFDDFISLFGLTDRENQGKNPAEGIKKPLFVIIFCFLR